MTFRPRRPGEQQAIAELQQEIVRWQLEARVATPHQQDHQAHPAAPIERIGPQMTHGEPAAGLGQFGRGRRALRRYRQIPDLGVTPRVELRQLGVDGCAARLAELGNQPQETAEHGGRDAGQELLRHDAARHHQKVLVERLEERAVVQLVLPVDDVEVVVECSGGHRDGEVLRVGRVAGHQTNRPVDTRRLQVFAADPGASDVHSALVEVQVVDHADVHAGGTQ